MQSTQDIESQRADHVLSADGGSTPSQEIFFQKGKYIVRYPKSVQEIIDLNEPIIVNQLDDPIPQSFGIDFETQTKMNDIIRQDVFDHNGIFFIEDTEVPLQAQQEQSEEEDDGFNDGGSGSTSVKKTAVQGSTDQSRAYGKKVVAMFMMFDMDKPIGYVPDICPQYLSLKVPLIDATNKSKANAPQFFLPEVKKARVRLIIVFREERGKGLLNLMFEAIDVMAKDRGFDCVQMTCTSPETFHVSKKFGYDVLSEVFFKEYPEIREHYAPLESTVQKFGERGHSVRYVSKFVNK